MALKLWPKPNDFEFVYSWLPAHVEIFEYTVDRKITVVDGMDSVRFAAL